MAVSAAVYLGTIWARVLPPSLEAFAAVSAVAAYWAFTAVLALWALLASLALSAMATMPGPLPPYSDFSMGSRLPAILSPAAL